MATNSITGPRSVALIGPYSSGKTTLLENLLFTTGAISRKGTIKEGNTVGDSSAEAKSRKMSVEISPVNFEFLGDNFSVLDCPGSIELLQESLDALVCVDAAVVVCEADESKVVSMTPLLRFLDLRAIPYLIFVNKLDRRGGQLTSFLSVLKGVTSRAVAVRQLPLIEGEDCSIGTL